MEKMKVLGLITARGGSKGVPGKNIKLLCGKPLLAYTVETALKAEKLTRVILSTEDEEIAEIGRELGVEIPFMRPAELAEDTTPTFPVVKHALLKLQEKGDYFDAVCLLQPTNPLRRAEDIDNCIELLTGSGVDCVVSVLPVPDEYNPKWVYQMESDGKIKLLCGDKEPIPRRQDLPPAYFREGSIYVTRSETILSGNSLYGEDTMGSANWRNSSVKHSGLTGFSFVP
jgi:CMP-N-acetylneuraminic acid synthetase